MNKLKWLRRLNIILFLSLLVQVATSLLMFFRLFMSQFGVFSEVHEYNGILFVVLVIAHLGFNWGWVRANIIKKD
jgi:hypothetical protein